ncbi:hypothetical protein V6N13_070394 [Hibiscus sabdariffa]
MRKVVAEEEKRNWVFRWPRNINHVQPCEAKERHDAAAEINKLNCRPSNFAFKKLLESMQGAGKVPEHAETKAGELREGSWWSVS